MTCRSRVGPLLGWLAGLGVAVAVLATSTGPLLDGLHGLGGAGATPDRVVAAGAAAAAWVVVAWLGVGLALTLTEVTLAALTSAALTSAGSGLVGRLAESVTPSTVRRAVHRSVRLGLVAGAVGTTLVAPSGAWAAPSAPSAAVRPTDRPAPLTWPVLDRPAFPVHAPVAPPSGTVDHPQSPQPGTARYRVRAGDSLWSIAADHLPASASAADVARAWPHWWRANRDVVGPDPGLIRPGQLLRVPGVPS